MKRILNLRWWIVDLPATTAALNHKGEKLFRAHFRAWQLRGELETHGKCWFIGGSQK
jgi:hypothetical protein